MSAESVAESKFIHDVSGVLSSAILTCEAGLFELQARSDADPELIASMVQINELLEKLTKMFHARREEIRGRNTPGA